MKIVKHIWKILIIFLTWIVYLFIRETSSKNKIKYDTILILYISGFGDILCLNPFYKKIREKFPTAALWICLPAEVADVQDCIFSFDGYIRHTSYSRTIKENRKNV